MATTFYLRNTVGNVGSLVRTEKSTVMPGSGSFDDSLNAARDLSVTVGTTQTSATNTSLAVVTEQWGYFGKWISEELTDVGSIDAQPWEIGWRAQEGNAAANAFLRVSIYVLTAADIVRGYIYDGAADLGVEFNATGQVVQVSGAAVGGLADTDRLAVEVWSHATQTMAAAYLLTLFYDGATKVTATQAADSASYVEAVTGVFGTPSPPPDPPVETPAIRPVRTPRVPA